MSSFRIVNGRILTPHRIVGNACVSVRNGIIHAVGADAGGRQDLPVVDARGLWVAPGFIDLHLHGGGGHDFMDCTETALAEAAASHARFGTTSMTPTTTACDFERTRRFIEVYDTAAGKRNVAGADLLGIHLEGPYLSAAQRGAQDIRFIKNPDPREYEKIAALSGNIVRWDAAPELPGGMEFGDFLRRKGIFASVAHSDATFEEAAEAAEHGYSHITHLYSGTSTVSRKGAFRTAGINEFAFLRDDITVEIIADGCHLPPALLKLIYRIKGPDRTILVTDAMRAAGTDMKTCRLGDAENGLEVIIEDGVAKMPDRSCFAGSVATMNRLVRTMVRLAGVPLSEAVRMATVTPARLMGLSARKGTLAPGLDADIVIFDDDITVKTVIVRGETVFQAD